MLDYGLGVLHGLDPMHVGYPSVQLKEIESVLVYDIPTHQEMLAVTDISLA